jgi:hypothetical protein
MTKLDKNVSRETGRTYDQGRQLVVTLEPGDMISFRQKGCHHVWRTTLGACFMLAVRAEIQSEKKPS